MLKLKLTFLIICLGFELALSQISVLDMKVSINVKNSSIKNVLELISKRTQYYFTYSPEIIPENRLITIKKDESSVKDLLDSILQNNNNLEYKIIEDHIIICKINDQYDCFNINSDDSELIHLMGIVYDKNSKLAIPNVSVGIFNTTRGTVTNGNGEFNLKIPRTLIDSSLYFGLIGYQFLLLPVNSIINIDNRIFLEEEIISIQEVIVKGIDPLLIIKNVRENIENNYSRENNTLEAFYREGVMKKKEIVNFSEAVIHISKSPYKKNTLNDRIYVVKSRKIINNEQTDTVFVKLRDGLHSALLLDIVKNPLDFFDENSEQYYNYAMIDIVNYLNREVYVIEFEQKERIKEALYKGKMYVDLQNWALTGAEFEINFKYNTDNLNFITKQSKGFSGKPLSVKYEVNYKKTENTYILNHVRADLTFRIRKKKNLLASDFHTFFEMIVLSGNVKNDEKLPKEKMVKKDMVFIDSNFSYDSDFWGDENYIQPEKDIEKALNDIQVNLMIKK